MNRIDMHLTLYTTYSLAVLIYLSQNQNRTVTISDIACRFKIPHNHLVKVVCNLSQKGYINTSRGKGGGIVLAHPPSQINLGKVIRDTEPHFHIAPCSDHTTPPCRIEIFCNLKGILHFAVENFMKELNQYYIADIATEEPKACSDSTASL